MSETADITRINIELLDASPTQPRKHFNEAEHQELVSSMRAHGFAFGALLVRPKPAGRYEIIIGERRTRAAREVGIKELPCQVRELPDFRVLELQLVENLQRKDLSPIETAESYERMLKIRNEKGEILHPTIESVAKRVGKDERTIRHILTLCNLDDEAKEAVESGILPRRTAYLIARIPDASRRAAASQQILHPESNAGEGGVLSLRDAEDLVSEQFMRDLRRAPFDQENENLVPARFDALKLRCAGGACVDCPFKSGNIPGTESQRKNSCLNPACYDEKIEAEWAEWQTRETDPSKKRVALGREESLAIFSKELPDQPTWSSGLISLDQFPAGDELKAGEESTTPWRELVRGAELEITVARDRKGKTHELVKREAAIASAKMNGHDIFKSNERDKKARQTRKALGLEPPEDLVAEKGMSLEQTREKWLNMPASREEKDALRKKQEMERSAAENQRQLAAHNCFDVLRKKAKPTTDFLRKLTLFIFGQRRPDENLLKRYRLPVSEDISRNIKRWHDADLVAFIVEYILTDGGYNFDLDDDDRAWLKLFGIDYRAEEKRLAKLDAENKRADKKRIKKALDGA